MKQLRDEIAKLYEELDEIMTVISRVSVSIQRLDLEAEREPEKQTYSPHDIGGALKGIGKMLIAFGDLCCKMEGDEDGPCSS